MKNIVRDNLRLRGRWRLRAYFKGTKILAKELTGNNLIVTIGKVLLCRMLIDEATYDVGFTHCAIGDDATPAPAVGDTILNNERNRLTITSKTRVNNELTLSTFFTAAQSTYAIEEAGIFGHTAGAILFSHWLVSFNNAGGLWDLTFDYVLTVG